MDSPRMTKTYCVVYRTGGTDNCQWHRTLATTSLVEAERMRDEVEAGGRFAMIEDYGLSVRIGLPEGWTCAHGKPGT